MSFEFYTTYKQSLSRYHEKVKFEQERKVDFGIPFLDDAFDGISPNDLVLIGGRSGAGKTELAISIAANAAASGKKTVYFALEAEKDEIGFRLAFRELTSAMKKNKSYSEQNNYISYSEFLNGSKSQLVEKYFGEAQAAEIKYENLETKYSVSGFTIEDLEKHLLEIKDAKLIVIDHLHYFDLDGDSENKELKSITKTIRSFVLDLNIPVVLVAHIRKMDKRFPQLTPEQEDFHGSSDVIKIATKAITIASGSGIDIFSKAGSDLNGNFNLVKQASTGLSTFMKAVKNRRNGSVMATTALTQFDQTTNTYLKNYFLGSPQWDKNNIQFLINTENELPRWASNAKGVGYE